MKVSIIILNYNGKEIISKCLESCFNINFPKKDFEVIVVDNNSSDGSCEFIKNNFPKTKIFKNKENLGTGGLNTVIGKAKGEYLFFLNNDNLIDTDCISYLINSINISSDIGMCAAKEIDSKDNSKVESAGTWVSRAFYCGRINKIEEPEKIIEIPYVGGVFIRKKFLEELGYLFDPDYFLYGEDLDLGLRARLLRKKTIYVPKAVIYHHEATTTKKTFPLEYLIFLTERNLLTTFFKITGYPRLIFYFPYVFGMRIFAILKDFIFLKPSHSLARIKAIGWIIANNKKIIIKRKNIQNKRKSKDEFVFKLFREKNIFKWK